MKNIEDIPVLLLLFNRPDSTRNLINALGLIKPKKIYIAQDGPRNDLDNENIGLVRKELKRIDWSCRIFERFQEKNLGCYKAVTSSIDWFFLENNFGIILEDDCIPSVSFFDFCLKASIHIDPNSEISTISGSNFLSQKVRNEPFLTNHSPLLWGWATWREKWKKFSLVERDKSYYISKLDLKDLKLSFFEKKVVIDYLQGDFWDANWYLTNLSHKWKILVPHKNLITNIGALGIHSNRIGKYHYLQREDVDCSTLTFQSMTINLKYDSEMIKFLKKMYILKKGENLLKRLGLIGVGVFIWYKILFLVNLIHGKNKSM